jgi:hypothetical protein
MSSRAEVTDDEKKPELAWIGRLSHAATVATRMKQRRIGSLGAASEGKRLMAWSCACGWKGSSRDLKVGPDGLACPMCGAGGLKPV